MSTGAASPAHSRDRPKRPRFLDLFVEICAPILRHWNGLKNRLAREHADPHGNENRSKQTDCEKNANGRFGEPLRRPARGRLRVASKGIGG